MGRKVKRLSQEDNFAQKLIDLISEPEFLQFENMLGEPNIFRIVGRTHYERWHSCFLGWLLDPNGSHLLSTFTLTRFLSLLLDVRCLSPRNYSKPSYLAQLSSTEFTDVEVVPNEYLSTEASVKGVGRFDVFLTATIADDTREAKLNLIVELKIDSKPSPEQSKRYADWLCKTHPDDINVMVYLTPSLAESSASTVGDDRWYVIDYQLLSDRFLIPIMTHPNLNGKVLPFVSQYIKNLTTRYRGIKMAITEEEKRLAVALYDKYGEVFDAIYEALLAADVVDYSVEEIQPSKGRAKGSLAVKLDGKVFKAEILRDLFADILHYVVDRKYILRLPMPWGSTKGRYIVTNLDPPSHPSGREFFSPVKYKGYSLETHYARDRGIKVLSDLCNKLEIDFEQIEM